MGLIHEKAKKLVSQMTLEEKAGLCSGEDCWHLKTIQHLGLKSIAMMDGPHGLRKQIGATDNLGIGDSVPAVCFPTASALACSFDRGLVASVGKAIGEECNQEGVSMILGPAVNQKRSPLCGRNFEYYSEDPVLSGELAAGMIQGIQSTGTAASLKHFAVNNQEKRRMTINAVIDERALRETYLKSFEIAVKKGNPATVMCAYNRLNGEYCSENKYLLTDILRKEWGFEGAVVSDWGAVHDRVAGIKAGLDIEMPGNKGYNDAKIVAAVRDKSLSEERLDKTACRVTELILRSMLNQKDGYRYDPAAHHKLAVKAAEQSAVLLKNEGNLLPGNLKQKAAVIGAFAKAPRYQGAGSSKIHPIRVDSPWDAFMEYGVDAVYAPGYRLKADRENKVPEAEDQEKLIREACEAAKGKDIVYLFAGLPEGYESEGFDRSSLSLPEQHNRLIEAVSNSNPNVVVILIGGAPMELPWIQNVKAVLLAYLGGEGMGKAIVNLLLGFTSPSGKLAETWPLSLKDTPSFCYFTGGRLTAEYRESIYVGYRYYEKAEKAVLFPFGHGLSYTSFAYSDLILDRQIYKPGEKVHVTFNIANDGRMAAKETALIFTAHENSTVFQPVKELREFVKIHLDPGETKRISVVLDTNSFGYYNPLIKDWYAESGTYRILVGTSSKDCALQAELQLNSPEKPQLDLREQAPAYYWLPKGEFKVETRQFETLYGKKLPDSNLRASRPYGWNNTLEDISTSFIGKIVILYADKISRKASKAEAGQEGMLSATILEMPFFSMVAQEEDLVSENLIEGILALLNGHYLKGLSKLLKA